MKFGEIHLGDIVFDPETRGLRHADGRPAQLRNKSKEVLRVLAEQPGQVISKSDLLDRVWPDVTVSDESLVQCIADIRRLIGKDARQIIETVPREGYRLTLPPVRTQRPRSRTPLISALVGSAAVLVAVWALWPDLPRKAAPVADTVARAKPPGTDSTEAYLQVLQGRVSANRFDSNESLVAERHFRTAIELDPTYARAHAELGTLFAVRFENDWTVLEEADKAKAFYFAEKAVELDPDLWLGHYALGRLHSLFSDLGLAETHLVRAMALDPGNEDARAYYGIVRNFQGDAKGALAILEPALAAHPNPPYWYYLGLGNALYNTRRYGEAEVALKTCLDLAPGSPYCLRYIMAVYGETGRIAEASAARQTYLSIGFDPSVGSIMSLMRFHHPDDRTRMERAFRQAGLPD